jgi:putative ABC transport system permease protein
MIVAFLLFGILETVDYAFAHPSGGTTGADKLITTNKYSITLALPFSYTQQIRSVPGRGRSHLDQLVRRLLPRVQELRLCAARGHRHLFQSAQGRVRRQRRAHAGLPQHAHRRAGQFGPDEEIRLEGRRQGAAAFDHLDAEEGCLAGLDFRHRRHFRAKDPTQASHQAQTLLFHYDLFDEGRSFGKGTVGWFEERVDDPTQSAAISAKVDALFANSSNETKTQPAKEFALAFIKQLGDIGFVLRAILGAVFFTLLFLTGNTMMQSVRERIPELAVLKTIGFGDGAVLGLVIGESLLLCLIAAVIGLGLSYAALPIIRLGLQGVELSPTALVPGFGAAVLLALLVGTPPALRAMRLNIVDALADRR